MDLNKLEEQIVDWALARKIIPNSNPQTQCLKAVSELGELSDAIIKRNFNEIIDGIGDVAVCLIILARLCGVSFEECLDEAYRQIKDRKGTLLASGVFVKEDPCQQQSKP